MSWYSKIVNYFVKSKIDELNRESVTGFSRSVASGGNPDGLKQASDITPLTASRIYDKSPYVLSATKKIASAVASLDLKVYKLAKDVRTPVYRGYPYKTLKYINPSTTPYEFKYAIATWLVLCGEAFIAIQESKDSKNQIYLEVLNNKFVQKIAGTDTPVVGIKYVIPGVNDDKPVIYNREQFIHIKTFNPSNHWDGHCDLVALDSDISIERYMKYGLESALKKVNNITAIVTVPANTSDDELSTISQELESKGSGYGNGHRTLVVKEGVTYDDIKSTNLPMSYEESKIFEISEGAHSMVLGVPLALLQGDSASDKLIELEAVMWKNTILPMLILIQEQLTKFLAVPENEDYIVEFDTSKIEALSLYKLEQTRMQVAQVMTGIKSPNEVRIDNGDDEYTEEAEDFGKLPKPVYDNKIAIDQANSGGASASLGLPGTQGGRDQSSTGEAQMVDTTGQKDILADLTKISLDIS